MFVDSCFKRWRFSMLPLLRVLVLSGCAQVPFDQTVAIKPIMRQPNLPQAIYGW